MTVKDLIAKKNYAYISWRVTLPKKVGGGDIFFGLCKSLNGELISLDGDTYSEDSEVVWHKEWVDGVKTGLTVLVEGEWM